MSPQLSQQVVCRFPNGYSAEAMLELFQLTWSLGSPAIAAHCRAQICQRAAWFTVSPADVDGQSWHLAAQRLRYSVAALPGVRAALGEDLVPVGCLTDNDVQVLLEAEEMLSKRILSVHIYPSAAVQCGPVASIAAFAANTVRETLERNNQLQSRHGTTLADCWDTALRIPRLGPKRTPASSWKQTSRSPSKKPSTVTSSSQDADQCVVCMSAPVQSGFLHGSR